MSSAPSVRTLPDDIRVFDRGWLSSTNTLCLGEQPAIIDTSYVKHEAQTLALVRETLGDLPLEVIAHTHMHSDHCGGTRALQNEWPGAATWVPAASFQAVQDWDQDALTYRGTGQRCARFHADHSMEIGGTLHLGGRDWQIHAAPGHDPLAVFLFEAHDRILIAGDALWAQGVGIIFPEIDGTDTFDAFEHTLDAIEALTPEWVIPGHGGVIARTDGGVDRALTQARARIEHFKSHPESHALYAAKVFVKYKLMDAESLTWDELDAWMDDTPDLHRLQGFITPSEPWHTWARSVVTGLIEKGALRQKASRVFDT